jgi:hypothetical protein
VIPGRNISAGELFELLRPIVVVISILLSAWVLASARKRFSNLLAFAWATGTLFLPLVVLPVYVSVILIWKWPIRSRRLPWLLPVAYATILLAGIYLYFRHESFTVDENLARATQAKLRDDYATAIACYRDALAARNDPHIRKLLAIELANAGELNEAARELRLAEQGGEPITCVEVDARCKTAMEKIKGLKP